MKISLIHYAAPPVVGGVESVIGHHARQMSKARHQVQIVAGRGEQIDPGIQYVNIPLVDSQHSEILSVKRELNSGNISDSFYRVRDQIIHEVDEIIADSDWVIAHNVCSLNKNLPLTSALQKIYQHEGTSSRLILWHHDLAWTSAHYQRELHEGFPWELLRVDWPDTVQVAVSKERRKALAKLMEVPLERILVIPNGIDIHQFLKISLLTQSLVDMHNLTEADPLLLLPVRITRRKNIELAINTLASLRKFMPDSKLIVTGPPGPHNPDNIHYFNELLALRKSNNLENAVFFLAEWLDEYLPDEMIVEFYRLSDGLLIPSKEEGFGIPIIEAGLAGIPVFCSDIAPLKELGGDQLNYFSLDSEPDSVAALIANYYSQDQVYQMRKRVRGRYSWQRIYEELIDPILRM